MLDLKPICFLQMTPWLHSNDLIALSLKIDVLGYASNNLLYFNLIYNDISQNTTEANTLKPNWIVTLIFFVLIYDINLELVAIVSGSAHIQYFFIAWGNAL